MEFLNKHYKYLSAFCSLVIAFISSFVYFNPTNYYHNNYLYGSFALTLINILFVILFVIFKYIIIYPSTSVRFRAINILIDLLIIFISFSLISINSIQFQIKWIEDVYVSIFYIEIIIMFIIGLIFIYYTFFMAMNKLQINKNKSHINSDRLIKILLLYVLFTILLVFLFTYYGEALEEITGKRLLQFNDSSKINLSPSFWDAFYFHFVTYMGLGSDEISGVHPIMKGLISIELLINFINTALILAVMLDKSINFLPIKRSTNENKYKKLFYVTFTMIIILNLFIFILNQLKPSWVYSLK